MNYAVEVFYFVFGLVFAGMVIAALPHYRRVAPYRPSPLWVAAIALASAGCLFAVPAPILGWPVFILVNLLGFGSFLCTALLCRSWRRPVGRKWLVGGVAGIVLFIPVWALVTDSVVERITLAFSAYAAFVLWILLEAAAMRRRRRSVQLDLLLLVLAIQLVIGVSRVAVVNLLPPEPAMEVFGEPLIAAFLRWVWLALYVGALMAVGGFTIEQLAEPSIRDHRERQEFKALNAQLEAALEEKSQMLRALTASARARNMGTMASTLAHELNQPLGAMRLNAEYLLRRGSSATAEEKRALEQILRDNERASSVIARLRSFFTAGGEGHKAIDLAAVLGSVRDLAAEEAAAAQVRLELDVAPGLVVDGDEGQLQIAFLNVVRNGIEALVGHPGERVIAISARREGPKVAGKVIDSGPGIAESERAKVFEIFYSNKAQGMGLGLWLSRTIIQRHAGSLSLADNPGPGATFVFSLPCHG